MFYFLNCDAIDVAVAGEFTELSRFVTSSKDEVEFTELSRFVTSSKDEVEFVWVTDGQGWKTARLPLSEAFGYIRNIFNLSMLKKEYLAELFKK